MRRIVSWKAVRGDPSTSSGGRRTVLAMAFAFALAACSSPDERARCSTTADCGPGEYCARTSEGAVCWPDAIAPVASDVTLTCVQPTPSGACPRDGVVRVTAAVSDEAEMGAVTASLSLAPESAFPLAESGSGWTADVALAELPFDGFEANVTATVRARDGAGNEVTADAEDSVAVTRLRWTYDAGRPLTPAAIDPGGRIVVGRADSTDQALVLEPDGTESFRATLGTADVVAAPMLDWFASTDGTLYRASDNTGEIAVAQCATGAALTAPPAMVRLGSATTTFAVVGNEGSSLYVDNILNVCDQTGAGGAVTSPVVVSRDQHVFVVAGSSLRAFNVLSGGALDPLWTSPPTVGTTAAAPAIDRNGNVWTVSLLGALRRTTTSGITELIATVGANANGLIVLDDDSVVLGDDSGRLKRFLPGGTPPWTETEVLTGTPSAPIAIGGEEPVLLTGTSLGVLYAIRASDGAVLWSHDFGAGALRIGNAWDQSNRPGYGVLPTAYFPASDGRLHAVVVDERLAVTPWPKPYFDSHNSGNRGIPRDPLQW
jgi:hypothetical protein